jgi:hypothetical protein
MCCCFFVTPECVSKCSQRIIYLLRNGNYKNSVPNYLTNRNVRKIFDRTTCQVNVFMHEYVHACAVLRRRAIGEKKSVRTVLSTLYMQRKKFLLSTVLIQYSQKYIMR